MRNKKVSTYCNGIRLLLKAQCHELLPQLSFIYTAYMAKTILRDFAILLSLFFLSPMEPTYLLHSRICT